MIKVCVECLDQTHNRDRFDCGEEKLNVYIRKQASQEARKSVSAVYVAAPDKADLPHVIGFYTLSAAQIHIGELPHDIIKTLPRYPNVPAFRIGRLGVDKDYQNKGIGETLLMDALEKCFRNKVAGIAVIVDAKNTQACSFYQKYGFRQFPEQPLKLFIPMKVIKNLFAKEGR